MEYVVISLNQLESRGRTSIKKIINLYIIAAQNNKDCVCFLYKQEPENIKSQLPVFITDEHGLKEIKVLLCSLVVLCSCGLMFHSRNEEDE